MSPRPTSGAPARRGSAVSGGVDADRAIATARTIWGARLLSATSERSRRLTAGLALGTTLGLGAIGGCGNASDEPPPTPLSATSTAPNSTATTSSGTSSDDDWTPATLTSGGTGSGGKDGDGKASASTGSAGSTTRPTGDKIDPDELSSRMTAAVAKFPTARVRGDVDGGSDGLTLTVEGDEQIASSPQMDLDVELEDTTARVIETGGQVYVRAGQGDWIAFASDDDSHPVAQQFGPIIKRLRIGDTLDALAAGTREVREQGTVTVDGVRTTKYALVVDSRKMMAAYGDTIPDSAPDTVIFTVWLDSRDLLRKADYTVGTTHAVIRTDQWGKKVSISAPS